MSHHHALADYVLKEPIGRGSAGTVHRAARDGGPDVALKIVEVSAPNAVASVRNEIRVLRRVHHPGVVELVDDGVESGVPWLAMELVLGERLDEIFSAASRLPRRKVDRGLLTILRRIAETLAYLHGRGVVHRDLSPRNVIVRDANPVLIDFGVASVAYEESRRSIDESNAGMGTLPYLAPEQLRGDEVDARADLYAFGCLAYQALTGRPPFLGGPQEIARAHLTAAPALPSSLAPDVPAELEALVMSLLAKDRRARTAYALDVVDRLALLGAEGFADGAAAKPSAYLYECSLVGRGDIVAELDARVADTCGGDGSFVCLTGESGVGKTRLLAEVARRAGQRAMSVVRGRCVSLDAEPRRGAAELSAGPLHALRSLLQLAADRCRSGGAAEIEHLFGVVDPLIADYDPTLRQVVPQSEHRAPLSPEAVRDRTLAEARHLLRAIASSAPLLVVLDDLQWADELTFALLESLRRDFFTRQPLLVVGAYRADEIGQGPREALRQTAGTTIEVGRLDRDASERVAAEMLGAANAKSSVLHDVLSDAQGNPFFLTEYMRTALTEGWLRRGTLGGFTLEGSGRNALLVAQKLPLPESVKVLFTRRAADLDDTTRGVLLAAAVIGADVPQCCLAGVVDELEPSALAESLDLLCERQILRGHADGYAFTHDKLRETIYELASDADCERMHLRAARWLEQHRASAPGHAPISDEALAHHFAAGGDHVRALEHLDRAADVAFRSGAHRAAAELFGRALEVADLVGASVTSERRAVWLRRRGEARFALGDVERCIDDSRMALALLRHAVPRTALGWAASTAIALVVVLLRRRRAAERSLRDVASARCAGQLASSYYFALSFLPMLAVLLWGLFWARRSSQIDLVIEAEARLAYIAGVAGLRSLARSIFAHAKGLATRGEEPAALARADYLEALYLLGVADFDRSSTLAESASATLGAAGDVQDAEVALTISGYGHYYRGDVQKAATAWGSVQESARDRTNTQHYAWGLFLTARTTLASGGALEAVAPLEEARRILRAGSDRSSLVIAQGLLALAYARSGALDRAAELLAEAMPTIARGTIPLTACFEAYASVAEVAVAWWRAERRSRARERTARTAVRALGRFARLFPLARPAHRRFREELEATRMRAETERPPVTKRPPAKGE